MTETDPPASTFSNVDGESVLLQHTGLLSCATGCPGNSISPITSGVEVVEGKSNGDLFLTAGMLEIMVRRRGSSLIDRQR